MPSRPTAPRHRCARRCGAVRAGRFPACPARTSTAATAGSSNTMAVTPEARRTSSACPTRTPATSVMRLRCAMPPRLHLLKRNRCQVLGPDHRSITSERDRNWRLAQGRKCTAFRRMAADVTILAALFAGLVSFLSPCVLPLVPPYLVYLAGTSLERLAEAEPPPLVKRDTVIAAVLFVAGFSTVFVALGASASVIGALMRFYSNELAIIAGIVIIAMGLHFLGLTRINF